MGDKVESAAHLAAQTGRLDLITGVLAALAILIALSAFPLFFYLRYRSETVAKEAVAEALNGALERVEREAIGRLEADLPRLVADYLRLAQNAASADVANEIAAAQDDGVARP
jgi:hypothetical protein